MQIQDDHFHDECGVVGVQHHPEAARLVYLGLYALQHRGQESAGIVASDGSELTRHVALGLVADVFGKRTLDPLKGRLAIGHVRYSTAGDTTLRNAQPLLANTAHGVLAIAHNGNLTNALTLRKNLEKMGSIFQTTSDTECILHLVARSKAKTLREAILEALRQCGRDPALGAVYTTLDRLEKKGLVESNWGEKTDVRGGRRKRMIVVTPEGELSLSRAESQRVALGRFGVQGVG